MVSLVGSNGKQGPVFYNVDQPVGSGATRGVRNEDTQLVQFLLSVPGQYRMGMTIGVPQPGFSGMNDEDTIAAITPFRSRRPGSSGTVG